MGDQQGGQGLLKVLRYPEVHGLQLRARLGCAKCSLGTMGVFLLSRLEHSNGVLIFTSMNSVTRHRCSASEAAALARTALAYMWQTVAPCSSFPLTDAARHCIIQRSTSL